LTDTNEDNRNPDATSQIIKTKKGAGIKTKTTAFKKPNNQNDKADKQESGGERHPAVTIIDLANLFETGIVFSMSVLDYNPKQDCFFDAFYLILKKDGSRKRKIIGQRRWRSSNRDTTD